MSNEGLKEIQKKFKGCKWVIIKIKYRLENGDMEVQHSPKRRYDPEFILNLLLASYQQLLNAFVASGKLKPPVIQIGQPEERRTYIG